VALAAQRIRAAAGEAVMIVLPADHWIEGGGDFRSTLRRCVEAAGRTGRLLAIGVPARRPDPGFGYIVPAGDTILPGIRAVRRFVEKPRAATAARLIRSGRALWNSGIFVWRVSSILDELRRHRPTLAAAVERCTRRWAGRGPWVVPRAVMRRLEALPIDRAVLERSARVAVTRARFRWMDLGNWDALAAALPADRLGNATIGDVTAVETRSCLAIDEGGMTVLFGVRDLAVVRSGGVVLVCGRPAAARLRDLVERLPRRLQRHL
jgi:mannose-1-phosphate guanylyltransferase